MSNSEKPNVVGVMTGYKITNGKETEELSILCLVEEKISTTSLKKGELIPTKINDYSTDVIEVGKIIAFSTLGIPAQGTTDRLRPCPMGTSGGHYLISAGTNGELLKDKATGKTCIGTNNHVGANSNNASIGDAYLQPGKHDGGNVDNDKIGKLFRFIPIVFKGDGNGNGNGNGCFIATAAYGSPAALQVAFLRNIRDNGLRKTRMGDLFVDAYEWIYYKFSPAVAAIMNKDPYFKNFMRKVIVNPIVYTLRGIFKPLYWMRERIFKRRTVVTQKSNENQIDWNSVHNPNQVDAAMIEVNPNDVKSEILNIGIPIGHKNATINMDVQKSGRTTGHTTNGRVTGIDGSVDVSYGAGKTARFTNQVMISGNNFSNPGDSGSLILDMNRNAVGKLFAGGTGITIANPIQTYLDMLKANLITQ